MKALTTQPNKKNTANAHNTTKQSNTLQEAKMTADIEETIKSDRRQPVVTIKVSEVGYSLLVLENIVKFRLCYLF